MDINLRDLTLDEFLTKVRQLPEHARKNLASAIQEDIANVYPKMPAIIFVKGTAKYNWRQIIVMTDPPLSFYISSTGEQEKWEKLQEAAKNNFKDKLPSDIDVRDRHGDRWNAAVFWKEDYKGTLRLDFRGITKQTAKNILDAISDKDC